MTFPNSAGSSRNRTLFQGALKGLPLAEERARNLISSLTNENLARNFVISGLFIMSARKKVARASTKCGLRRSQMDIERNAYAHSNGHTAARHNFARIYHTDETNDCPACGHSQWHIGRSTAECAFCETALPLPASRSQPAEPLFFYRGTKTAMAA